MADGHRTYVLSYSRRDVSTSIGPAILRLLYVARLSRCHVVVWSTLDSQSPGAAGACAAHFSCYAPAYASGLRVVENRP